MTTKHKNLNKYKNLWANDLNIKQNEFYENSVELVLEYREFKVYKLFDKHFDYVLKDACVTQRAGKTRAQEVIDSILDGKEAVSKQVKNYFTKLGVNLKSYDDFKSAD